MKVHLRRRYRLEAVLPVGAQRQPYAPSALEEAAGHRRAEARPARAVHLHAGGHRADHVLIGRGEAPCVLNRHAHVALSLFSCCRWFTQLLSFRHGLGGFKRLVRRTVGGVAALHVRQLVRNRGGGAVVVRARAHVDRHAAEAVEVLRSVRVEAHRALCWRVAATRVCRRQPARLRRAALSCARRACRHAPSRAHRVPVRGQSVGVVALAGTAGVCGVVDVAPRLVELLDRPHRLWTARVAHGRRQSGRRPRRIGWR